MAEPTRSYFCKINTVGNKSKRVADSVMKAQEAELPHTLRAYLAELFCNKAQYNKTLLLFTIATCMPLFFYFKK